MGYYNSFIIRIWSEDSGKLHGTIVHVSSRESLASSDLGEMWQFLLEHLNPSPFYISFQVAEQLDKESEPVNEPPPTE